MLLAALTALFGVVGYMLGGANGMLIALGFAVATNIFAYWNSDRLALAAHDAMEVDERTAPELVGMVRDLARPRRPADAARLPHRQSAAQRLRDRPQSARMRRSRRPPGILHMLTHDELAGVMAHELAHIKNRDTLIMTVSATIAGAIATPGPVRLPVRRARRRPAEPARDARSPRSSRRWRRWSSRWRSAARANTTPTGMGAEIGGKPLALASALAKIAGGVAHIPNEDAERHPATAPLFIINPLSGRGMDNLFSTHPATENRIAALQALAREMGQGGVRAASELHAAARVRARGAARTRRGPWG